MTSATVVGGGKIWIDLAPVETKLAQAAIASAAAGRPINIIPSTATAATAGAYNLYNPYGSPGGIAVLPANGEALVIGNKGMQSPGETAIGHTGQEILIGDSNNDTLNGKGGYGSIFAGGGMNVVQLNDAGLAGAAQGMAIFLGKGKNNVNMWGGSVTVDALGKSVINLISGSNTVIGSSAMAGSYGLNVSVTGGANRINTQAVTGSTLTIGVPGGSNVIFDGHGGDSVSIKSGNNTVHATGNLNFKVAGAGNLLDLAAVGANDTVIGNAVIGLVHTASYTLAVNGNDTISFGSGDTITQKGVATISSGVGGVTVQAGAGNDSTKVGAQAATLIGGSGSATLVGGSVSNLFAAGSGHDAMFANTGASDVFNFSLNTGGSHSIAQFTTGQDHINLVGYGAGEAANVLATATYVGGNTVAHLSDGTQITLVGYHLTAADIH